MAARIDFQTEPGRYRHWKLAFDGEVAELIMDVDENAGLFEGYQLKLNSYDLGVDIELNDAIQRLRFEHPEVKVVVLRSGKDRVFCAGANIRMLAGSSHAHKVNFCKFTNETRNSMEDASDASGQKYICAVRGTAAGGGYELALATDYILLADDGSSTVALPELPLLAVLPGTGGLTRVTDKRKVRRDLADAFCTVEEGVKGARAVKWRLVDQAVPNSKFDQALKDAAGKLAAKSDRPTGAKGIALAPIARTFADGGVAYSSVKVEIDRDTRRATLTIAGPASAPPASAEAMVAEGAAFWPLRLVRELDDAILHLRLNEPEIGVLIFKTQGEPAQVLAFDQFLEANKGHWLAREILALLEAHAEAGRPHLALAGGADRARQLLCRHACRARLRLRPLLHADRRPARRQPPAGDGSAHAPQLRRLSHEQRPVAARHALPRRARERRDGQGRVRQAARSRGLREPRPRHRRRSITSTGRTRCASSSRSAPPSPPTASPAWRRTCASPAPRPWRPRSSAASRPGRTGSSSGPMRPAPRAPSSATAPA